MAECPKCHGLGWLPVVAAEKRSQDSAPVEQRCLDCDGLGEVTLVMAPEGRHVDPNSLGQLIIQLETEALRLAQKADEVRKSAQHFVEPLAAYRVIAAQAYEEAARLLEARAAVYSQRREEARKRQPR